MDKDQLNNAGNGSGKKWILLILIFALLVTAGFVMYKLVFSQSATNVLLDDSYEIQEGRVELGDLDVVYSNGETSVVSDYVVYIDGDEFGIKNGSLNAERLPEGQHQITVAWKEGEKSYEYEKSLNIRRSSFENLEKALREKYGETSIYTVDGKKMIRGNGIIELLHMDMDGDGEDEMICLRQEQNAYSSVMNCSVYDVRQGQAACIFSLADHGKELRTGENAKFVLAGQPEPYFAIVRASGAADVFQMKEGVVNQTGFGDYSNFLKSRGALVISVMGMGTKLYIEK